MSDPTARRGDNVMALLQAMVNSRRGWNKRECLDFLFRRYRFGVREETLEGIFNQLKDRGVLFAKPKAKGMNVFLWWVNTEVLEQLTGVRLR